MQRRTKKIMLLLLTWLLPGSSIAGEVVVYVTSLSTSYSSIGMRHTLSGLFLQSPGDTAWSFSGRPNNRVYSMDAYLPAKGRIMALATHSGVHQSWDFGKTWKVTSDWRMTEVNNVCFDRNNPAIIYASSPYGFYKTVDDGKTWKQYNNGLNGTDASYISAVVLDCSEPNTIYISTEDGVYVSQNSGESWRRAGLEIRNIRTLVQHPQNPDIFMVGSESHGLYVSLDHGVHWEKRDTGVLHETFYCIAFAPSNPDIVFAGGFQTGVYKSVNGGKSWQQYFNGLGDLDIHAIAVDPQNHDRVYVGTIESGVYLSNDGGATWRFHGIDKGYIWSIKILTFEE